MITVVFGGHSPIALTISKELSQFKRVIHITRKMSKELTSSENKNLKFVAWDYKNLEELHSKLLAQNLKKIPFKIDGVIFGYRNKESKNLISLLETDLLMPKLIIDFFIEKKLLLNTKFIFLISNSYKKIIYDQNFDYHILNSAIEKMIRWISQQENYSSINVYGISLSAFIKKPRSNNFYRKNIKLTKALLENLPKNKFTSPSEISETVTFLLTCKNQSLNGEIFHLDGGFSTIESASLLKKIVYSYENSSN